MKFQWNDQKNAANLAKHGIRFEEAAHIFRCPILTSIDTRKNYGEVREITIGQVQGRVYLVVVHTDREGVTRLISARRAKQSERKRYDEHIKKITR